MKETFQPYQYETITFWALREQRAFSRKHAPNFGISYRVDEIELDIHLSNDEKLIVMHDDRVDKTADGYGKNIRYDLRADKQA
ncbi:MAG: glycerophosphodiester phosphodiesterase family protein [Candidatus Parvarchaeota archaeon]